MSGHNKWSKIKHKKATSDAQKSKVFGKISNLIAVESRACGGDINAPALRAILDKAKSVNMPAVNIQKAIERGKNSSADSMERVLYEAYGPGGVAILIEVVTDNRNRSGPEIKHILSNNGASVAAQGSALWIFKKTHDGYSPKSIQDLSNKDMRLLEELVEKIESHPDINAVYTNTKI